MNKNKNKNKNTTPQKSPEMTELPVVGIAASAGGLDAFKRFFSAMPADCGMAFVLIPHLDPKHESLMVPLLGKQTKMPVVEAEEGQRLKANHVYIIPPNRYLSLNSGVIQLSRPPVESPGGIAIDPFLRSLADDQQERSICIVLSGTGSHGALGLKAVKAAGGMAMVQEPSSAEYDQMPRSAIDTGLADYILPPEKMPEELLKYVQHFLSGTVQVTEPPAVKDGLTRVLTLVRARTKFDFRAYRKRMLLRRIQRRMGLTHKVKIEDYLAMLRDNPEELSLLCKDLLISVTSFFRDPEMFKLLETQVLPPLLKGRGPEDQVRVWVPGCATGEEAYSIAMLLIEAVEATGKSIPLQIFATDVDDSSLEIARGGLYPLAMLADVSKERIARFFTKIDGTHYQAKNQLREMILFAPQNLLSDAPFSKLDLVSCRNLLIYLEPHFQQSLLELFHFALNPGGYLVLGPSESIGRHVDLYSPVSKKWRIFRRTNAARPVRANFPVMAGEKANVARQTSVQSPVYRDKLSDLTRKVLLDEHTPAAVVIDRRFEVLHYSGPTFLYLQQPGGAPSHDLLSMAHHGLRARIRAAVNKVIQGQGRVDIGGIRIKRNKTNVMVRISVQLLPDKREAEELILITFQDELLSPEIVVSSSQQDGEEESLVRQLEYELKTNQEELQSTIEELESSNEELKASNEEAMSMNEELQSTNEELETSKEELQSLNEELSTVNAQLQDKLDELEVSTNDMLNMMSSVDTAILFIGSDRTIQRFTPSATRLFNLIDSDLGRPIGDITRRFDDPDLSRDIDLVLNNLKTLTIDVPGEKGRWYLRNIKPYRTADNRLEGAVLTFTDITPVKQAQLEFYELAETLEQRVKDRTLQLREEHTFSETLLDTVASLVIVFDTEKRVVRFNKACEDVTGFSFDEMLGTNDWKKLIPVDEQGKVADIFERLKSGEDMVINENHWLAKDGSKRLISWTRRVLKDADGKVKNIIGTGLDITDQRKAEIKARHHLEAAARLQRLQTASELATVLAHELNQPLAAIAMYAESGQKLLDHMQPPHKKISGVMGQISEQSLRAGEIIRRLREFVNRGKIEVAPMDLNTTIHHVCALMATKALNAGIKLNINTDEDLPDVLGDEVHIEQVLFNLIRNAIEALQESETADGCITVTTSHANNMARVCVRDNGPGVDEESVSKLFEPFYSTKEDGLGVGLRISRSLIQTHGGELWVEPQKPGGIFNFSIPFVK